MIYGHEKARDYLAAMLQQGKPAHAIMLIGPAQIGKFLVAEEFAGALLCDHSHQGKACGQCKSCQMMQRHAHPDVLLLSPDAGKQTISVETYRQVEVQLSTSAFMGKHKVLIVRDMDMANNSVQNAALKTIEEPPRGVILILLCAQRDLILPTILSRVLLLNLNDLPVAQTQQFLAEKKLDGDWAMLLQLLCGGRPGKILQLLAQEDYQISLLAQISGHLELLGQTTQERMRALAMLKIDSLEGALNWLDFELQLLRECGRSNSHLFAIMQRLGHTTLSVDCSQPARLEQLQASMRRGIEIRGYLKAGMNFSLHLNQFLLSLPQL